MCWSDQPRMYWSDQPRMCWSDQPRMCWSDQPRMCWSDQPRMCWSDQPHTHFSFHQYWRERTMLHGSVNKKTNKPELSSNNCNTDLCSDFVNEFLTLISEFLSMPFMNEFLQNFALNSIVWYQFLWPLLSFKVTELQENVNFHNLFVVMLWVNSDWFGMLLNNLDVVKLIIFATIVQGRQPDFVYFIGKASQMLACPWLFVNQFLSSLTINRFLSHFVWL